MLFMAAARSILGIAGRRHRCAGGCGAGGDMLEQVEQAVGQEAAARRAHVAVAVAGLAE